MEINYLKAKKFMFENVDKYVSWHTHLGTQVAEVNTTKLAEETCDYFYDYEEDGSISQRYYDIAYQVANIREKELNRK